MNLRQKNPELLKLVQNKFCENCQNPPPNDAHHLRTRGAGGDDSPDNLMALCRKCHTELHAIGTKSFVLKYNLQSVVDTSEIYPKRKSVLFIDPDLYRNS